jgi:hypothetical protein
MALSVRTRFEVFKRDQFACQYCGLKSPEVVLEVDHIVPVSNGGSDDPVNLTTSCWSCNRGKSDVPLARLLTGEDPHDRAVMLLERERQLEEYNAVLAAESERRERETWELVAFWKEEQGYTGEQLEKIHPNDYRWLKSALQWCPKEKLREFMETALNRRMTKNLKYVAGCARNWRYEHAANEDLRAMMLEKGDGY